VKCNIITYVSVMNFERGISTPFDRFKQRLRVLWIKREQLEVDGFAMALSGLCALHCLVSAAVLALLASAGGFLLDPIIHEVGLGVAVLLAGFAYIDGLLRHGYLMPLATGFFGIGMMFGALSLPHNGSEILATIAGVGFLALGHDLNRRANLGGYFRSSRSAATA
jgi:hypothetical protein